MQPQFRSRSKTSFLISIISISALFFSTFLVPSARAAVGSTDLAACVAAVNDPLYTASEVARLMGKTQAQLESAITANTIIVWVASGSGTFGAGANGNGQDLFCGNGNANYVPNLDSNPSSTKDFFFGGAGNDSITNSWFSDFYGGLGDDAGGNLQEASSFYGGPGNDTYSLLTSDSFFYQDDPIIASSNANLTSLVISSGTLSPIFDSSTVTYTATVASTLASGFSATATRNDLNASVVQFVGASGTTSFTGNLSAGENIIRTIVTAQNGTTIKTYTLTVTRPYSAALQVSSAVFRTTSPITATLNGPGIATFYAQGKRIPKCIRVLTTAVSPFTATCSWKPAQRGPISLSLNFYVSGYSVVATAESFIRALTRTNVR